ncbi:MAG: hypothetical protein J6A01_10510, partial [Proteobacteria bacterium]|nr:hypothetical protein [Pseudomonadota bacterium]
EIIDCKDPKIPRNIQRFEQLHSVRFVRCHALTGLGAELGQLPALRELGFIRCADFHDLTGIGKCKNLVVLHVSGCDCFDDVPEELAKLEHLRALDLSYSESVGWINLAMLPKSLRLLDMHGCWQGDFSPEDIRGLRLVSLQIQDMSKGIDWDKEPVISDLATQLRHTLALRNGCALDS